MFSSQYICALNTRTNQRDFLLLCNTLATCRQKEKKVVPIFGFGPGSLYLIFKLSVVRAITVINLPICVWMSNIGG